LYSEQQSGVVQKATVEKSAAMPAMGVFALLSVGGLVAGVGVSAFRRRRSTRQFTATAQYANLEEGPVE
jgi:hypothetical protein